MGFFGHSYYRRVKPLERAHLATELLLEHPLASMTSFALIVLGATSGALGTLGVNRLPGCPRLNRIARSLALSHQASV